MAALTSLWLLVYHNYVRKTQLMETKLYNTESTSCIGFYTYY